MEKRWVDKIYTFLVDAEGQPVSKKFDLDKNVKVVHGIVMSSDKPNLFRHRHFIVEAESTIVRQEDSGQNSATCIESNH